MTMFSACLVLALAASSCTAVPHFLDVPIDNVKKMVLEYDPVRRVHNLGHNERVKPVFPLESFAIRQFHDSIKKAEIAAAAGPIPDVAAKLGLTDLVDAVVAAGLKDTLDSAGPFTVFGPDNDAFANLPEWAKEMLKNVTILTDILTYHVLSGKVESKSLANELVVDTVEGKKLRINLYTVDGKQVATAQCAPIDLTRVDQAASNGVIHVLKDVMYPPPGNLVVLLSKIKVFSTLVEAAQVAGLVDTLAGPGPFTLFAPTNNAFAKLPPGTIEKLLANPTELAKILKYHVLSGTYCSAGLSSGNVETVEGQDVKITVSADGVVVNESKVIAADASVTNGVVHAIDTVLLPPGYVLS
ncbi:transforming growth factor-beta-induced protein ig-h3-like [Elysia marginata]|uniref:Transforming growth factor-beta-induced protein ig-h3-like n=1 Tax=Elysia marginata TaxID=1093978 RepID=A0AAV4H1N1_9GAST|nr:transforming growth factor-beta-induced protein ig-h3-like [Elysia marginata]